MFLIMLPQIDDSPLANNDPVLDVIDSFSALPFVVAGINVLSSIICYKVCICFLFQTYMFWKYVSSTQQCFQIIIIRGCSNIILRFLRKMLITSFSLMHFLLICQTVSLNSLYYKHTYEHTQTHTCLIYSCFLF